MLRVAPVILWRENEILDMREKGKQRSLRSFLITVMYVATESNSKFTIEYYLASMRRFDRRDNVSDNANSPKRFSLFPQARICT